MSAVEKIGVLGAFASFLALVPICLSFGEALLKYSPSSILREFWFLYRRRTNYVLTFIAFFAFIFLSASIRHSAVLTAMLLAVVTSLTGLWLSFFLRQNKTLIRQYIIDRIEGAVKSHGNVCAAIRFDIDLIVAINDFSYAVGQDIYNLLKRTIKLHESKCRNSGMELISIDIPEGDEVIWILPKASIDEAADAADAIRRELKASLQKIPYYREARDFVINKLRNPPLTDEEKEGIGTVSAGVAAYTRGAESLLTDIASASKECKFRGRNRTIVYRRDQAALVRDH